MRKVLCLGGVFLLALALCGPAAAGGDCSGYSREPNKYDFLINGLTQFAAKSPTPLDQPGEIIGTVHGIGYRDEYICLHLTTLDGRELDIKVRDKAGRTAGFAGGISPDDRNYVLSFRPKRNWTYRTNDFRYRGAFRIRWGYTKEDPNRILGYNNFYR